MSLLSWIFGDDFKPSRPTVDDLCTDCGPHDDDLLDKTEMKSGYDQMDSRTRRDLVDSSIPSCVNQYFRQKVVFTFKCKKCGRVKQETHVHPEPE